LKCAFWKVTRQTGLSGSVSDAAVSPPASLLRLVTFYRRYTFTFCEIQPIRNGTQDALRMVPRDIVICDWHYERVLPSVTYFAVEGFPVVACPWRKPNVALGQLAMVRDTRAHATNAIGNRMQGVLQTTWVRVGAFAKAYFGEQAGSAEAQGAVQTFRAVFEELRAIR
jgi:hypothetical protein